MVHRYRVEAALYYMLGLFTIAAFLHKVRP
jgi:hypothetical protein